MICAVQHAFIAASALGKMPLARLGRCSARNAIPMAIHVQRPANRASSRPASTQNDNGTTGHLHTTPHGRISIKDRAYATNLWACNICMPLMMF